MTRELIGVPEAADILNVNRTTVWRWVEQGKLRPVSVVQGAGGKRKRALFDKRQVEDLAQREATIAVA